MDESEVVLDVSNTLVASINGAVADLFPANTTIAAVNDLSEATTTASPLPPITVFLYEIMEDPASRNLPLVQQTQNKTGGRELAADGIAAQLPDHAVDVEF